MRKFTLSNPSLDNAVFSNKGERILSLKQFSTKPVAEHSLFAFTNKFMNSTPTNTVATPVASNTSSVFNNPLMDTMKNDSRTPNFVKKGLTRLAALAALMLLSLNVVFGQTLIAEYPFNNTLAATTGAFGNAVITTAGSATLGATSICTDNLGNAQNGLSTPNISSLSSTNFQVNLRMNLTSLPSQFSGSPYHTAFIIDGGARYFGLKVTNTGKLRISYNNSLHTGEASITLNTGVDYNIEIQYINGATKMKVNNVLVLNVTLPALAASNKTIYLGDNPGAMGSVEACFSNLKLYNNPTPFSLDYPTITSLSALSGTVGSNLIISGTNFDATASNNRVFIGNREAVITSASSTSLEVTVPNGFTNELVTVVNQTLGLAVQSKDQFKVTQATPALSFSSQLNVTTATQPAGIKCADFDGDGKLDFAVVAKGSSSIQVFLNTSSGSTTSFSSNVSLTNVAISQLWYIEAADFNSDGLIDIAVQDYSASKVHVFKNNSTSGSLSFSYVSSYASGSSSEGIEISDINGDGKIDVLISNYGSSNVAILRNTSVGSTISFAAAVSFAAGNCTDVAAGDIDGDGKNDIITTPFTTGDIKTLLNTTAVGSETITFANSVGTSVAGNPWGVELGDLDLDGDLDVVITSGGTYIYINNSTIGSVSYATPISIGGGAGYKSQLGDIDGDGKLDILAFNGNSLIVYKNNYTSGTMSASSFSTTSYNTAKGSGEFTTPFLGDFNSDGFLDLGKTNYATNDISLKLTGPSSLVVATPSSFSAFSSCDGTASSIQTTSVSGTDLTANVVITAPTGYQISLASGSGYTSSITLTQSGGTVSATTIYIRLSSATAVGTYNGNLTIASTGATTVNVALSGTVNAMPTVAINPPASVCSPNTVDLTNSAVTVGSTDVQTFTYWTDNGATSAIADPTAVSAAGTYYIKGTSSAGCSVIEPVTVSVGSSITSVSLTLNERPCGATATGSANVTVTGAGSYTYTWTRNGVSYAASPSNAPTNLSAGTYIVTVSNGCGSPVASNSLVISNGSIMTITSTTNTNNTCYGGTAGTITAVISGGAAPRTITATNTSVTPNTTYSISVPSTGTTYVINNLPAGNYTVSANDISSCTPSVTNVIVTQPNQLAVTASKTDATCNGLSDGTATATVSGGTASYTYQWLDGSSTAVSGATSATATSLAAGTYSVRVTDACGAQATSSTVTIAEPTAITIASATKLAYNGVDLSCATATDGEITVTASGGTGTLQYSKNNGTNYQASNVFSGLAAGTYTIKVKDANNCTSATTSVTITAPAALTGTAAVTSAYNGAQISCPSSTDGAITVTAAGGTGTKQYSKDNGSTWQASNVFTGLAAGTYQMKIKDANDCESSAIPTTIAAPAALALTSTQTNITCHGGSTGAIDLTVTGGSGTKTYLWDDGAASTTQDITGLAAATYTVTVTDGNSCTATTAVTITQLDAITATATPTAATCNGTSTGSIAVTAAAGGAGTYEYSKDNGTTWQSGATFSLLAAGTYQVSIRDAVNTNCVVDIDGSNGTVVGEPAVLAFSATSSDVATTPVVCFGDGQGSISISNTSGGTVPYEYSIDGNTFAASPLTSVVAGTYTLTVKDANNCTATTSVTIAGPTTGVVATNTSQTNVDCFGNATGSVEVTATSGTGTSPYEYKLDNGSYSSTNTFGSLVEGTYTVTVKDANSCTTTVAVTITQPAVLAATNTAVNVTCNGLANGSIDATITGGTSLYTYSWSNGSTIVSTSEDISSLAPATYTLTVTDANGCTATSTAIITQPAVLAATNAAVNVTCNGLANGSIDATITGGTSTYTYSWSDGSTVVSTSEDISSLAPVTYTLTVTDANGCTATTSATITQPAVLAATNAAVNVTCNNAGDGSITTSESGGTSPYSYTWADGNGPLTAQTTTTEFNQSSLVGWYTMIGQTWDFMNSQWGQTQDAGQTFTSTGGNLSSIQVHIQAVDDPGAFTFSLYNGAGNTGSLLSQQTVQINNSGYLTITLPTQVSLTANQQYTFVFSGTQVGARLSITSDSYAGGGEFSSNSGNTTVNGSNDVWFNNTYIVPFTGTLSNLSAGTYTATITDANGCTTTTSATITEPSLLAATITSQTNVDCYGNSTGSVEVTATSGTGTSPYEYKIGTGSYSSTNTFGTLAAGTYTVTVKDANGCETPVSVTITEPASALSASNSQVNNTCFGGTAGSITASATGGTAPYEYKIGTGTYGSTPTFGSLAAGSYTVTVKDANGCETTTAATITEPNILAATVSKTNANCNGVSNGSITIASPTGGAGTYEYTLDGGTTWTAGLTNTGLAAGTYNVQIRDAVNTSCIIDLDGSSNTVITEPVILSATVNTTNISCNAGTNGTITVVTPAGGTGFYNYSIDGGTTWQASNTFTGLAAGSYNVQIRDVNAPFGATAGVINDNTNNFWQSFTATSTSNLTAIKQYLNGSNNTFTATLTIYSGTGTGGTVLHTQAVSLSQNGTVQNMLTLTTPVSLTSGSVYTYRIAASGLMGVALSHYGASGPDYTGGQYSPQANSDTRFQIYTSNATACSVDLDGSSNTTLTEPTVLTASITSQTDNVCFGGTAGAATASGVGGTAPYTYVWSTTATSATISSLAAGTYSVNVTDAKGCTATTSVTITEPTVLSASITSQTDNVCYGASAGSITAAAAGGTAPYEYKIGTGAYGSTPTFGSLAAGAYTVTVKDANGCETTTSATITEPDILAATITAVNASCNGLSDGSITLSNPTGGLSSYDFTIDGGTTWSSATAYTGLAAGTYDVQIRDFANPSCIIDLDGSSNTVITQPGAITVTSTAVDVLCNGANTGSINITVAGGTSPYTYAWSNGVYSATTENISTLYAGTYTVTVTDANGCTSSAHSKTITEPTLITGSGAVTSNYNGSELSCVGSTDGTITVTASGGTGTLNYSIDEGAYQTSNIFTGLAAGVHVLDVKDANGCIVLLQAVTITAPGLLEVVDEGISDAACSSTTDGAVPIYVSGGTGAYTYAWTGPDSFTSTQEDISNLLPGTYAVTVTDANGCTTTGSFTVASPPAATVSLTKTDALCHGSDNGTITATLGGGTPPYGNFVWTLDGATYGNANTTSTSTTATLTNALAGLYTLSFTDAAACPYTSDTITVGEPATGIDATATVTGSPVCIGGSAPVVTFTGSLGTAPYTFAYRIGLGTYQYITTTSGNSVTINAPSNATGTFNYVLMNVEDVNGCITYNSDITDPSAQVVVNALPTVSAGLDKTVCNAGSVTLSGTGAATYTWDNSATNATAFTVSNGTTSPTTTTYTVTGTDANGCVNTDQMVLTINPTPTVTATTDEEICAGTNATAVTFTGSVTGTQFDWTNSATAIGLAASGTGNIASFVGTNTTALPIVSTVTVTPVAPAPATIPSNPTSLLLYAYGSTNTQRTINYSNINLNGTSSTIASVTAGSTVSLSFSYTTTAPNPHCPGCVVQIYLGIGGTTNSVWCANGQTGSLNGTANVTFTAPASPGTYYIVQNGTYDYNCIAQTFTATPSNAVAVLIVGGPIPVSCYGTPDTFTITVNPAATANAGTDATICSTDTKTLAGTIGGGASSLTWSTSGTGTFDDATSATAVYTPSAADITAGSVVLTVTTDDPTGPCNAVSDAMTLTINPAATADAGVDAEICSTTASYTLAGSIGGSALSSTWTTSGDGTFDDLTSLSAVYTPGSNDITTGSVTLTVTTDNPTGPCNAVSDAMVLTITPVATADAGIDATICSNDTYTLAGVIGGSASSLTWTTSGTGTFNDATSATAIYTPSAAEITAGTVTLTLTTNDPTGPCGSVSDDIVIIINPAPIANAGSNDEICSSTASYQLAGSIGGSASTGTWTSSGSGTFDVATSLTAVYTPSAADKTAGTVTLTLTTDNPIGTCNAVTDQLVVTIQPTPVIAAINDTICSGETFTVIPANGNGNVVANGTTYTWSAPSVNGITSTNSGTNQASISDVLVNETNQPINVTYTVTPTYQQPTPTVGSTFGGGIVTYILQASDPGYVNGQTTMLITSPVDISTGVSWYIDNVAMSTTSGSGIGHGLANTNSIITALQNLGANPANYAAGQARNYNGGGFNDWYLPSLGEWAKIYQNVPNLAGANTGYWSSTRFNSVRSYTPLLNNQTDYSGNGWSGGYVRATRLASITPSNLSCTGNTFTVTVRVNPKPSISNDAAEICSESSFAYTPADGNGSGNIVPSGTTYSWTSQAVTGITGISNGTNKTQISDTLTNTTDASLDVTYTVTPTSALGCIGLPFDYVVTVHPTPRLNSAQTLTAVCSVSNNVAYTATSPSVAAIGSTVIDWSRATINGITESASSVTNDPVIAETLTNTSNAPLDVTYIYTITANGCSDTNHVTITINPTPTVDAVSSQTLCNADATTSVTFTSALGVTGTTYSWSNDTQSIGLAASGSGDITSFTAINTSGAPITATIVVTPTANSCDGATKTFTITVNPTPNVNPVIAQTLCNGNATTAINFSGTIPSGLNLIAYEGFDYPNNTNIANQSGGFGWAGNWEGNYYGNSSMYVYSPGLTYTGLNATGNKLQWAGPGQYQPHSVRRAIDNPNSGIVYFQFISDFNSTSGGTDRVDLNYNGSTMANIGGNNPQGQMSIMAGGQTINSGYSVFDPSLVVVQIDYDNHTTKMWVNPTLSGFDYNNPGTPAAVYNNSIPFDQISLTFRSGAVIDELTVYGGTSYNWTNDNTATGLAASGIGNIPSFTGTNTSNAPIVSNITVTPSLNGCTGTPITTSITVNPTPTVDTTVSQTLCVGSAITAVNFTSQLNVQGTVFDWTNTNTSIGLSGTGTGNIASFTPINTTNATETATIIVTPSVNGCVGTPDTFAIVVNPVPNVDASTDQTLCNGELITAIPFASTLNVSGTIFNWVNNTPSIGLAASGSGDIAAFNAVNISNAPITARIIVTPSTANCVGIPDTIYITVQPTPTVDAVSSQTLCAGEQTDAVVFTSAFNVSGTSYSWVNDNANIGLSASNSGDISAFTSTNATSNAITGNMIVTPSANGCIGDTVMFTYTVNATPDIADKTQTICTGGTFTISPVDGVNNDIVPTGTQYTWTVASNATVTGESDETNLQSSISQTLVNPSNAPIDIVYTVTPSVLNNGVTCTGDAFTVTVTVNPTMTIANETATICSGATFAVTPANSGVNNNVLPVGTWYQWVVSQNNDVTGQQDDNSHNPNISQTLVNTSSATQQVIYTVTPYYNNAGETCSGQSFDVTVNVLTGAPAVNAGADQTICANGSADFSVVVTDAALGSWGTNGTGVISPNVSNTAVTYTPSATDVSPIKIYYTALNSCGSNADTALITLTPLASPVASTGTTTFCLGTTTTLVNAEAGGTWSTNNINIATVDANGVVSSVATGTATITYTYSANGCTQSVETNVTVDALPVVAAITGATNVCVNGTTQLASATTGGTWSTSNNTVASVSSTGVVTGVGAGTATITYSVTNGNGCSASQSAVINVNAGATATITAGSTTTFCQGGSVVLTASAGSSYLWSNGAQTQAITVDASGSFYVTVTSASGCSATSTATPVSVNPLPIVSPISGTNNVCAGLSINLTNATIGGSWTTSNASFATVNPSTGEVTGVAQGSVIITYTVTNGNGCVNSTSSLINVGVGLTAMVPLTGNNTICAGTTTQVSHPLTGGIWYSSNPTVAVVSNTGLVTGISAGTTVITYEVTNAAGCASAVNFTMTVNPQPIATITASGSTIFCEGGSVTLTASPGTNYAWNTGDTTASISVYSSGTYNVIVTGANGCTTAANPKTVVVNATPIVSINANGPTSFCQGGSVVLTATPGSQYLWSDNTTNQSITLTSSGNYSVTVTNNLGCNGISNIVSVNVATSPTASITASAPTICVGSSTTLTANGGTGFTYLWSNGATTQAITVSPSATATYTVSVSNANGCASASVASQVITVNPLPVATITASASAVCVGTSATLTASAGSSYLWSTGATTAAITVTPTSTTSYSVTVTNANGCSATSAVTTIGVNPLPVVAAISGPNNVCAGLSITLTNATAGGTWSSSNTALATVDPTTGFVTGVAQGAVTITYTVTNGNGCVNSSSNVVNVGVGLTAMVPLTGSNTICAGTTTQVSHPLAGGIWYSSNPTVAVVSNTGLVTGVSAGTAVITYEITNNAGCASAVNMTMTVNAQPTASITASGPTTFCQGGSVTLAASPGSNYAWNIGGPSVQSISVSSSGTYNVIITGANGCTTAANAVTVVVNPTPMVLITPSGPTTFCQGGSVTLTASAGASYSWNGISANTQSVTVSATGNYSVTVTNSLGCTGTSAIMPVSVGLSASASIIASGPTTLCQGGSVTLIASSGTSYSWSGNNAITQSNTVSTAGVYTVTVTNSFGCSATSAPVTVTVNPLPVASITPSGPTTFCQGGNVILTASAGASYSWSNGGAPTQSITVNTSGTYTVTVTNASGCVSTSASVTVTVNALPLAAISNVGPTTFCQGGSVTLLATPGTSYLWSGNNATTQSNTISTSGNYTVTVMNAAGCSATSAPTTVTVNPIPVATITPSGPTTFCQGGNVILSAGPATGVTYLWSNGLTTPTITVTTSGNYWVTVTSTAGCSSTATAVPVTVNALPLAAISTIGATTFCQGGSVTLLATPGTSYLWSVNNATTQSNIVSIAGNYTVTVMNAAGCTATSAPVAVTVNALPAIPVVVASGPTAICPSGSVTLTAPAGFTTYSWNNGATSPSITVNTAGNYKVTVTNANGCSATSALTVVTVGDNTAPVIVTPANITLNLTAGCSVSNLNLGTPVVTDNCLIAYVSNNAPYTFPIGTTVVTWTALDASGNVATANQTITIVDTIAPTITVPATVTVAANNGCDATGVFIGDATATDNCTTTTITNDAPAVFPLGTTVVTWIATDASGNADTLTQNIVVEDLMAPVIAANNQTVTLDLTGNVLIDTLAINTTANDNCGVASVVYSQVAFDCSNVGANTITITVTDNSGNVTSQQITVTVLPSGVDEDFDGIDDACDDQIDTLAVVIPSGFTPNADNINDYFQILGLESYASKTLEVFNRYGNQVYESANYANQWDGTLLDTGEPLPDATYYYVLSLDGKLYKGYVYINRVK